VWHRSDGTAGSQGGWASGKQPGAQREFGYLIDPDPFGEDASPRRQTPALYATSDVSLRRDHRSGIAGTFWYLVAAQAVAQAGADITAVACPLIAVLMVYTKTQATAHCDHPKIILRLAKSLAPAGMAYF
jgi:hypothetical protein